MGLGDGNKSGDSLGIRWHAESSELIALVCQPIVFAEAHPQIDDSVVNPSCRSQYATWISVLEEVEDIPVSAVNFQDCYRFRVVASGWGGDMARFNVTSYYWFAKHVDLIKSKGPKEGEHWPLKSASVGGQSYP